MTFAHILGHERQKNILRRALAADRLAHAYLFEGPEGIGKRLLALALVRAVFCHDGSGCGDCPGCRKVDHGNHPDLQLIEPDGTSIKIEQIRELQKQLSYSPLEAPRKVCVIDGADRLNPAAGNALLKTLEEPSRKTLLLLLTPRPDAVLSTVRSRCQRLPFSRLPREMVRDVLQQQLDRNPLEAHVLAALSDGSFKKALGRNRDLYLDRRKSLLKSLTALSPGSIGPLLALSADLAEDKDVLPELLEIVQAFFRDLLLTQHGATEEELVNRDLLDKIHRVAWRWSPHALLLKLDAISACQRQLERNVNRQLALDVLLLRLAA